jgi:hypothetical protein
MNEELQDFVLELFVFMDAPCSAALASVSF